MLNKTIKIIISILMVTMLILTIMPNAYADDEIKFQGWDSMLGDDVDEANKLKPNDTSTATESVGKMANSILSVVQVIGMAVAVIMLIVLAIKYISAAPSDKAEIKKHAVVYVVGAVVLFAASGILGIVRQFAGNISAT